jgi:hypothetical protein
MSSRRKRTINMPAPYLRRVWLEPPGIIDRAAYPFCLPFLSDDFELAFDRPITIIVGENGTGKSTLLEGIAVLAGYDEAGGGRVLSRREFFLGCAIPGQGQHRSYPRRSHGDPAGLPLALAWRGIFEILRGALPKPGYLHLRRAGIGAVARAPTGIPEADAADGDVHDLPGRDGHAFACPDAYPGSRLRLTKYGLEPVTVEATDHYKIMREFCDDPAGFVEATIEE